MKKSLKDESRESWVCHSNKPTPSELSFGALQRIADATELMAKRHQELIQENERLQRLSNWYRTRLDFAERSLSATKGAKTKLRNELNRLKAAGGGIDGQANPAAQGPASRQG